MAQGEKVLVGWSGGKDSALALLAAREAGLEPEALLTTLSAAHGRVSMHGLRRDLLRAQTEALGIPLHEVPIPAGPCLPPSDPPRGRAPASGAGAPSPGAPPALGGAPALGFTAFPTNEEYEKSLREALEGFRRRGVNRIVFGDIFLEDLKAYRDRLLAECGMSGIYPLWGRGSLELYEEVLRRGIRAVTICVDSRSLDSSWLGRPLDRAFLEALPPAVDPCGENGEYHTFVHGGPGFTREVKFRKGSITLQDRFWFLDLERPAAGG